MSGLVDAKERFRIEHDGLHDTLFVEAGAGTGKTHELVERVVNLVVEAGVPLRTIAAITFTEAAAAELRDRVREAFEQRLASDTIGDEERAACRQAMAEIDQAAIGTLHGFCLRILSEHPLDVDLPPRVEILDEVASQLAFQDRWNTFVDRLYEDPSCEDLVLRAWALHIEIDAANAAKASFKDVASVFEDSWDRLDGLLAQAPSAGLDAVDVSGVRAAFEAMQAVVPTCSVAGDRLRGRCAEIEASVPAVLAEADPLRQLALLRSRSDGWRVGNQRGVKGNWADVEAARAAVDAVGTAARAVVDRASDQVLRQLARRLAHFTVEAAEQRRAVGHLVFHDLLVLARRLLRTSAEARAELAAKYDRLLLDEFQDTDPIQVEVAVLLASAIASSSADAPWDAVATGPGRLFFVGDPKQSIYRFRRADIGLFLAARDRFSREAGGTVVLGQNFRTVSTVLDWVNTMFGALMPDEVPACQPAYQPLTADRADDSGADHRVLVLGGAREGRAGDLREAEAAAVARTIASVRSQPDAWPVFDDGAWRAPRWEDVTILVPTRTSLRQLEDALDFAGVPYRVATGSLVFDTQEVREALDALRAIDDPGDELALVSALRSPLYACSDVDLFTYHRAGGRWDLRQDDGVEGLGPDHPVVAALDHLRSLADARWWSEPSALLDRLLRERHAHALAFGSRRPREVWRRLRFIVDQARAYEESASGGVGGLRGFLAWAELQRTEGTRVHEPLMAETDDDAVSILTIHGAKGLEFPITVLSGMTTAARGRRKGPQVFWDGDVPEVRFNKDTSTDNFDRLADIEAEMDVHERLRLLYVACTRARDHLVVSGFHKPARQASYGQLVATHTEGSASCRRAYEAPEDDVVANVPAPVEAAVPSMPLTLPFDDREGWVRKREALLAPHREARFVSATTLAADAADAADTQQDDDGDEDDAASARPEIPWRRGRAGTAIGRAVHAVLEVVGLEAADVDARIDALAAQQAHVEAVPDAVGRIGALVRSALRAPSVRAAFAAGRHWRELYVAAPIGERAVEGYVDLLYERDDGGLVLVDYKTDAVGGDGDVDAKVERYALQTAAYAVALEVSTGLVVAEARLVFCTEGEPIERAVPGLEGVKAKVRALLV